MKQIPPHHEMFNPLLRALKSLGGSGSIEELDEKVIEYLNLPAAITEQKHDPETGNKSEIEYRLGWARTYLKKFGLIENSSRGIWSLTNKADAVHEVDVEEVLKFVRSQRLPKGTNPQPKLPQEVVEILPEEAASWRVQLYRLLTNEMEPAAFERLVQRLLRESGFVQVEVTGRTGDGGIDGKGIAKINGIMSFHVVFQCKRYKGSVSSGDIRNFRGAMVGRADKGLFITTGSFTRDALKEATRDGASPIDLIDGDQLIEKLKELRLGIAIETVENVTVDASWFKSI